jgi:hypothetical protein
MQSTREYVIRVVIGESDGQFHGLGKRISGAFLECLRYAGLATVHYDNDQRQVFDLHSPKGVHSRIWADHNAYRMMTFGYNAVAAPSTESVATPEQERGDQDV